MEEMTAIAFEQYRIGGKGEGDQKMSEREE